MNTIVREHYPVAKLPEDLREGLDPSGMVVVTVTPESRAQKRKSRALEIMEHYHATHPPRFRSVQDILDHVRRVRDGGKL
ncbi:MAG: hypothetical protein ACHQAY_20420 [Hyphomicrobiales bacterium]